MGRRDFASAAALISSTSRLPSPTARHFLPGLRQSDFAVHDDDQPVDVTYFSADRVPVSLGIVLDTSGSMAGDKITRARVSIEQFLEQPRDPDDEVFVYGFASDVALIHEWTNDRDAVSAGLRRIVAIGGTAMYDAVIKAARKAQSGRNRKKAVVLISDGNDTSSSRGLRDVRRVVRETELLVCAIGIDNGTPSAWKYAIPL